MKLFNAASLLLALCVGHTDALSSCDPGEFLQNGGCVKCIQGTYNPDSGTGPCLSCPNGSTTASSGSQSVSDCAICVANFFLMTAAVVSPASGAVCEACPNGRVTDGNDAMIVDECLCGPGMELDGGSPTSAACIPCNVGEYSDAISGSCDSCDYGETTDAIGSDSADDCICAPGLFNDGLSCASCPSGTAKPNAGDSEADCMACPIGFYEDPGDSYDSEGTADCEECPEGTTTVSTGTATRNDCVCDAGFQGSGPDGCTPCPNGQTSTVGNDGVCTLTTAPTKAPITPAPVTSAPVVTPTSAPVVTPTIPVVTSAPVVSPADDDDDDDGFLAMLFSCFGLF